MEYVERAPQTALAHIVRKLWFLRGTSPRQTEKILPVPAIHVIVNLGEPYSVIRQGDRVLDRRIEGAFISGVQTTYLLNENPRELHHVGAEIRPGQMRAFSAAAIGAQVVDASPYIPQLDGLRPHLRGASALEAIDALEATLVRARDARWSLHPALDRALNLIDTDPSMRMSDVAKQCGVSPKHLAVIFKFAVGITPKAYAETVRHFQFREAIPHQPPFPRWADLVASAGYYDQPHFIRTFTRLTGLTPRQYLESRSQAGDGTFLDA